MIVTTIGPSNVSIGMPSMKQFVLTRPKQTVGLIYNAKNCNRSIDKYVDTP